VFDPLRAIEALNACAVDFVVVGGWATLQHGATRLTQDIDICPDLTVDNLQRLAEALTDLHAGLAVGSDQTVPVPLIDQRLLFQMEIGNWSTDAGRVDILQRIPAAAGGQLAYRQLHEKAIEITDEGQTFLVASLADITASKRAAGRRKDLEALPELDRLLAAGADTESGRRDGSGE
jgi:hypothetical protein